MEACITPLPDAMNEIAGGELKKFPDRLFAVPPRIAKGSVSGVTTESYHEDNKQWKKHVIVYERINRLIGTTRYRNIMDMNAGLGGFAAALESPKSWVMNVVPTIAENTLGAIYERGLIGIYHDWYDPSNVPLLSLSNTGLIVYYVIISFDCLVVHLNEFSLSLSLSTSHKLYTSRLTAHLKGWCLTLGEIYVAFLG